ncbi:hypothetical protein MMC19_002916 [Ptychographa xylographoides]|nr:hypothetical protein [Ptychographa xylographoides]
MPWRKPILNSQFINDFLNTSGTGGEYFLDHDEQCSYPASEPALSAETPPSPLSPLGTPGKSGFDASSWIDTPSADMSGIPFESSGGADAGYNPKRIKAGLDCWNGDYYGPDHLSTDAVSPQQDSFLHQRPRREPQTIKEDPTVVADLNPQPGPGHRAQEYGLITGRRNSDQRASRTRTSLKRPSSCFVTKPPGVPTESSSSGGQDDKTQPLTQQAKASHCQVERKYRENLNTKFEVLRQAIPSLQHSPTGKGPVEDMDVEDLGNSYKPRKADILAGATDYVKQMEGRNRAMENEIEFLRSRVKGGGVKQVKCEDCWLLNGIGSMKFDAPSDCNCGSWMPQTTL